MKKTVELLIIVFVMTMLTACGNAGENVFETYLSQQKNNESTVQYDFDLYDLQHTLEKVDGYCPINLKFNDDVYLSLHMDGSDVSGDLEALKKEKYVYEYYKFDDGKLVGADKPADQFIIYLYPARFWIYPSYYPFSEFAGEYDANVGWEAYQVSYNLVEDAYYKTYWHVSYFIEGERNRLLNERMTFQSYGYNGYNYPIVIEDDYTFTNLE